MNSFTELRFPFSCAWVPTWWNRWEWTLEIVVRQPR